MTIITQLQELITALDRRIPQVARAGERTIAHDAAALRDAALARLAQLEAAAKARPAVHRGRDDKAATVGRKAGSARQQDHDASLLSFAPAYTD